SDRRPAVLHQGLLPALRLPTIARRRSYVVVRQGSERGVAPTARGSELRQIAVFGFGIARFGALLDDDLDALALVFVEQIVVRAACGRADAGPASRTSALGEQQNDAANHGEPGERFEHGIRRAEALPPRHCRHNAAMPAAQLVGFDLKLDPAAVSRSWTSERRGQFLLHEDVAEPISVDPMVWPSRFWQPHVPPGMGIPQRLGTVAVA